MRANNKPYSKLTVALTNVNVSNSNEEEQHSSVYSEKSNRLFARYSLSPQIFLLFVCLFVLGSRKAETRVKTLANSPLKFGTKITIALIMFGMKKSLTFVGLLAITGANAGAVDLTEGDFDAQVFESGKVR